MDITLCHVRILPDRGYRDFITSFIYYFYYSNTCYFPAKINNVEELRSFENAEQLI